MSIIYYTAILVYYLFVYSIFAIADKGRNKLIDLKLKTNKKLPPVYYSKSAEENKLTIVIFDVPEIKERKRAWLRSVLKYLNLKMIQKSIWSGKVKIPKQFLEDLNKLRINNRFC